MRVIHQHYDQTMEEYSNDSLNSGVDDLLERLVLPCSFVNRKRYVNSSMLCLIIRQYW